jgi:hypothetical protein
MVVVADADSSKSRRRRRPTQDVSFASALSFGKGPTLCLVIFLVTYALVLLFASPLLYQKVTSTVHLTRGQVLKPVVSEIKEKLKHLPGAGAAGAIKKQLESFRKEAGVADKSLIDQALEQLNLLRKAREDTAAKARENGAGSGNLPAKQAPPGKRPGFFVLGMHRSGTSMLSGLLVTGLGYEVGGPLIGSKFDNEKGFFELIDVVLQNDEFMNLQQIDWSANVYHYDYKKALEAKESGEAKFTYGKRALLFLNNADNAPWIQKDPRMCITLKTWLPLITSEPAVLWTYRHPMEVAHSLIAREASFSLDHALRIWIVYNMRGIQNSAGLCRVYTNNDAVLANPLNEVKRLSQQLTDKCGVPPPPNELTEEQVAKFVDTSLQHNKKKVGEDLPVIEQHGDCKVHDFVTTTTQTDPRYQLERKLYLIAMKLYCDMGSEQAYKDEYHWPDLENL